VLFPPRCRTRPKSQRFNLNGFSPGDLIPVTLVLWARGSTDKSPTSSVRRARRDMTSERRLAANRKNAKRSTGPRTARGKLRVRSNAVRHALATTALQHPAFAIQIERMATTICEESTSRLQFDQAISSRLDYPAQATPGCRQNVSLVRIALASSSTLSSHWLFTG
jgi:hypothetical protein